MICAVCINSRILNLFKRIYGVIQSWEIHADVSHNLKSGKPLTSALEKSKFKFLKGRQYLSLALAKRCQIEWYHQIEKQLPGSFSHFSVNKYLLL